MLTFPRSRLIPALLLLSSSLISCQKKSEPSKDSQPKISPAALQASAASVKVALEGLKKPLGELSQTFVALHREFDPLPPGLPDFGETRAKFYATDIGLGTMGAKVPWLAGRIDAAVKASDGAELERISRDIAHTHVEMAQVDRIAGELREQVKPFKKLAEQKADELQLHGKLTCD